MTFLIYSRSSTTGAVYACMDTLGKQVEGENDFFMEKAFFLENNHMLVCVKGLVNLIFPLLKTVIKMDTEGYLREDIEAYMLRNLNICLDRMKSLSSPGHDIKSTVCFLYWEESTPKVSKITNVDTANFEYYNQEILSGKKYSSNNVDISIPSSKQNHSSICSLHKELSQAYEYDPTIAELGTDAMVSHFNDPPESYTGGMVILYIFLPEYFSSINLYSFEDYNEDLFMSFNEGLNYFYLQY